MIDDQDTPDLADVMAGKGAPFQVDGVSFRIRPPTTEEYDDAMAIERLVTKRWLADPALQALKAEPCSEAERAMYEAMIASTDARFYAAEDGSAEKDALADQLAALQRMLDKRTLADEVAGERAQLARDRYLTQRLLCDEHDKPVFDLRSPDFTAEWERLPLKVKNAARSAVWLVLGQVRQAPFSWDRLRAPKRN